MSSILVHFTSPPYSAVTAEGLDFAISATNYGHDIIALFCDDAVWMWHRGQDTPAGIKNVAKRLKALPFFDIEKLYVCETSLQTRPISAEHGTFERVSASQIVSLFNDADHVVTF